MEANVCVCVYVPASEHTVWGRMRVERGKGKAILVNK